jgi:hypothetical protein
MRILMVFILAVTAGNTVFLALWLHGYSGRVDEKVQTFLSYSLSFTAAFLALLTIFVSIATITRDIKRKEIFTIATKPIKRIHFLLGKFLGMALLNLILLSISAVTIFALARYYLPRGSNVTPNEKAHLEQLVFTARQAVKPEYKDVQADVEKWVNEKVQEKLRSEPDRYKNNPVEVEKMRRVLTADKTKEFIIRQAAVSPGGHLIWHFTGVNPPERENGYIFVRFKQDVTNDPPDLHTYNEWMFGPQDPLVYGGMIRPRSRDVIRTVHEFTIPAGSVSEQGDLYVLYHNPPMNRDTTVIYQPGTGIEVLYVAGTFSGNFLRTTALIYLRLLFLGTVGLAMGAWLSFPVAVLLVLVVYVLGLSSSFIASAITYETSVTVNMFITVIMKFLPSFSSWDPVPMIEKGRLVSVNLGGSLLDALDLYLQGEKITTEVWNNLLLLKDMLIGAIAGFIGYIVFRFRELARIVV